MWDNIGMILPPAPPANIPNIPFYSQFQDIQYPSWQKKGCGVASLAMVIDYYRPDAVSVDTLLSIATSSGAYNQNFGWIHKDLVQLARRFGLEGSNYDLGKSDRNTAFARLKDFLKKGPVITSVHYRFDPKSTIPHLVVVDGIVGDIIYYNDPAAAAGKMRISVDDFLDGWKKKFIVIRPASASTTPKLAEK